MTILVQQQLRDTAREIANWSGSLTDTWVSSQASYMWIVGCIDEDDQKYPVVRIEADAYGHQGESERLAEFLRLANPKAVLALLDELDQLKAENAELIALMRRVVAEHPRRSHKNDGNGPGHGHAIPGVWDEDNGELAGKPCAWCSIWNAAKGIVERHEQAMTKEQP